VSIIASLSREGKKYILLKEPILIPIAIKDRNRNKVIDFKEKIKNLKGSPFLLPLVDS